MALVSGAIVITAGFERSFPALTLAVVSLASAATALWIIHIVVFGLRAATYARSLRGDNYGGRFSDDYDGRWDRSSGPVVGRGGAPTGDRV
ncbi:hypothetical protein MesoLj131b_70950 (plasmid) [Mesorhizobium sp. 131-2-5]|nr:hypothetical protein [Mesorhizobium sp. 131-2-5]BCH05096.1 hypothetical protein MesoLj131b_70950 [Mesorhizobium sp. 131-2-5]